MLQNFSLLIISFLPFFLIIGPAISEISLFLLIILNLSKFSVINIKNIINGFYLSKYILLFFIFVFFSALISFNNDIIISGTGYLRYLIFIFILYHILIDDKKFYQTLEYLFYGFSFIILAFCLDSIFQLYFKENILGFKLHEVGKNTLRVSSFFNDELIMGSFFSRFLPFVIAIILMLSFKKEKIILSILAILTLFLVLISSERAALLYNILTLIFLIIYFLKKENKKFNIVFSSLILISLIILSITNPKIKNRLLDLSFDQLLSSKRNFVYFSDRHNDHIITAYNIYTKNLVFGAGPKSFRYLCGMPEYTVADIVKKRHDIYANQSLKVTNIASSRDINLNNIEGFVDVFFINKNGDEIRISNLHKESLFLKKNQKINKGDYIGNVRAEFKDGCNTHPHNNFFQIASEIGTIGLFIYIFIFLFICKNILSNLYYVFKNKNIKNNFIEIFFLLSFVISWQPLIPSGNFFNGWINYIYFMPLPFYMVFLKKQRKKIF